MLAGTPISSPQPFGRSPPAALGSACSPVPCRPQPTLGPKGHRGGVARVGFRLRRVAGGFVDDRLRELVQVARALGSWTPRKRVPSGGVGRRLKRQLVAETLEPGSSVSIVARRHDVNANQLFKWRHELAGSTPARRRWYRLR